MAPPQPIQLQQDESELSLSPQPSGPLTAGMAPRRPPRKSTLVRHAICQAIQLLYADPCCHPLDSTAEEFETPASDPGSTHDTRD